MLAGPVLAILIFGVCGLLSSESPPVVWIESALEVAVLMVTYTACACVIGLQVSLKAKKNVTAVMYSVGLLILLCGILSAVGFALVEASGSGIGALLGSFTPFTSIYYLVDSSALFDSSREFARGAGLARIAALIGSVLAVCFYALVFVWTRYMSLVRNFDMIVRKQSGT